MQEDLNKSTPKWHSAPAIRLDISVLRILSCLMIVWYHAGLPYHELTYSGLVIFIIMSMYLLRISLVHSVSVWSDLQKRARRILLPWAFWSMVYGAFLLRPGRRSVTSIGEATQLLLAGTSIHLWYLPFIWLVLLLAQLTLSRIKPLGIWLICEILVLLGLLTSPSWREESVLLGAPWGQYLHASLAVGMGMALLVNLQIPAQLAIAGALANLIASIFVLKIPGIGIPYAVGSIVCIILMRQSRYVLSRPWINTLANATFGVYLTHIIFLRLAWRCGQQGTMGFLVATAASFVSVIIARKLMPSLQKLM